MKPATVGVESLCGSTVRINVHPAVAAAFQFSDDFPVCHNCICLIGFEMFWCTVPVFGDMPCSDTHFRYAVAYSCLSRSRLLSVSGVYPSRRMYPPLQPVSSQCIPAASSFPMRFCAVFALEYSLGQK